MVSAYAGLDDVRTRATVLRAELLDAGERELHAYAPVLSARSEQERLEALSAASDVPVAIARASSEVAELGAQVVGQSKPALKGDAVAGVLLAEAAARAAARLAEINLRDVQADPRLAEVAQLSQRAADARERAVSEA